MPILCALLLRFYAIVLKPPARIATGRPFQIALEGGLRESPLRGLAWRLFLGAVSGPDAEWVAKVAQQQIEYDVLCHDHCVDPHSIADATSDIDLDIANPLSTSEDSPFNKFFASSALREQLDQDLARLNPGDAFFERPDVQAVMHRILFVWASCHPQISYRQGMHELLAPLLFTNWVEAEEAATAASEPDEGVAPKDDANNPVRALLVALLRRENVEVATWVAFSRLMTATSAYFEPGTGMRPSTEPPTTPLLRRCSLIQDERLRAADPALHARMISLGVQP
jgi:TBC1 domain family protein 5